MSTINPGDILVYNTLSSSKSLAWYLTAYEWSDYDLWNVNAYPFGSGNDIKSMYSANTPYIMVWKYTSDSGRSDYFCTSGFWFPTSTGKTSSAMEFDAEYVISGSTSQITCYHTNILISTSTQKVTKFNTWSRQYKNIAGGEVVSTVSNSYLFPIKLYVREYSINS